MTHVPGFATDFALATVPDGQSLFRKAVRVALPKMAVAVTLIGRFHGNWNASIAPKQTFVTGCSWPFSDYFRYALPQKMPASPLSNAWRQTLYPESSESRTGACPTRV